MIKEIISNLSHRGKTFTVETRDTNGENSFIETGVFHKDQLIFSRKTNYATLRKCYSDQSKLEERLITIIKGQHKMILNGLEEGNYDSLLGIGEKYLQLDQPLTAKTSKISQQEINLSLNNLKKVLATSLLATYFWDPEGKEIIGYSILPKESKIFNQISTRLKQTLENQDYPTIGKHYILDMIDNFLIALIPMNNYHWGLLIDTNKIQFKTLINTILPDAIKSFEKIFFD
jgi:hypothetical protein